MLIQQCKRVILILGILAWIPSLQIGKAMGAEQYPAKTITVVCGYSAGGGTDKHARIFFPFVAKHLGKSIMIENLPGAQGLLATNKVFSSTPDGYTLLVGSNGALIIQEKYFPEVSRYKTNELSHISSFVKDDIVMLCHTETWKNIGEFLKSAQGRHLRIGTGGKANPAHLYSVMLEQMTNLKFNIIPFEGGGESMTALAGKHIDALMAFIPNALPLIRGGTFNPLLVFSNRRTSVLPQTPIPEEVGFKSFESFDYLLGVFGPPKLPADQATVLEEAIARAAKEPEYLQKAKDMAVEVYFLKGQDYLANTEKQYSQVEKYIKILKGTTN